MDYKKYFSLFLILLLATACEKKVPLKGKRETIGIVSESLIVDPSVASENIIIDMPRSNSAWTQGRCNSSRMVENLACNFPLKQVWSCKISGRVSLANKLTAEPVVFQDDVFVLDNFGSIHCIKKGKIIWSKLVKSNKSKREVWGSLGLSDGVLYVATSQRDAYALDMSNGDIIWHKNLISPARGSILVYKDMLYILSIDSRLEVLSAKNGERLWEHAGISEDIMLFGGGGCAAEDDIVVTPYPSGEVFGFQAKSGLQFWSQIVSSFSPDRMITSLAHIVAHPVIDNDLVCVASSSGKVVMLNLFNGRQIWEQNISGCTQTPLISVNSVFLVTSEGDLVCLSKKTGTTRWIVPLTKATKNGQKIIWHSPIMADGKLVVVGSHGVMLFLSPINGKVLDSTSCGSSVSVSPVMANGKLYILTDEVAVKAYQ